MIFRRGERGAAGEKKKKRRKKKKRPADSAKRSAAKKPAAQKAQKSSAQNTDAHKSAPERSQTQQAAQHQEGTTASDAIRRATAAMDEAQTRAEKKRGAAERLPDTQQLRSELAAQRRKERFFRTLRSTIGGLIVVAACAVLVATLLLPVLRIYGTSMTPTLSEGQIVVSVKGSGYETGDIIAFYYEGKILIKRVIAASGSWVDIDDDGNVYVDGVLIDEPYLTEKALGECDIDLPYQVPDERVFVMGDHRSTSVDSRSSAIGAISEEEIVGKIVFRVWPLNVFGPVG